MSELSPSASSIIRALKQENEALRTENSQLRLECDGWRKQREATDRIHNDTMRGWANTLAERDRYHKALEKIRHAEGLVCEIFEICKHRACNSSYAAWAIADEALNPTTAGNTG